MSAGAPASAPDAAAGRGPLAYVVGHPVAHARSPVLHRFWLDALALPGAYELRDVAPDAIHAFLRALPQRGDRGCNVTIPYKEAALRAADVATPRARAVGAANTLWVEGACVHADNTDVPGFLAALDEEAPGWDAAPGARAVVVGAGGAARAAVVGLAERGLRPLVLNRDRDRAREVAALGGGEAGSLDDLASALPSARVLVNATSLGMRGQPPFAPDLAALPADAVVTDVVYVPLETALVAAARARGLRAVGGLGMLLHQAAPAFERFFGVRPLVTEALRARVEADLRAEVDSRLRSKA